MQISISHFIEGARSAEGIAVIIDVFRAFSLAAYAFDKGADSIIPVDDIGKARRIKELNPHYLLVGERNEMKPPDFDFGNSPTHILLADLKGKTLVHTTSAGTQGLANALNASIVITGSFVNAEAIVRFIQQQKPEKVSLIPMGYAAQQKTEEDTFCARYIRNSLNGKKTDFEEMKRIIRNSSGQRFFLDEKQSFAPASDFDLCLQLNRFDFVLKLDRSGEALRLKKCKV